MRIEHSTYIEMERTLYQESVKPYFRFIYDKDLFNTCHVFTCRVLDALVFVLMSYEKRMIDQILDGGTGAGTVR